MFSLAQEHKYYTHLHLDNHNIQQHPNKIYSKIIAATLVSAARYRKKNTLLVCLYFAGILCCNHLRAVEVCWEQPYLYKPTQNCCPNLCESDSALRTANTKHSETQRQIIDVVFYLHRWLYTSKSHNKLNGCTAAASWMTLWA